MSTSPSIELDFHVTRTRKGRKQLERGKKPEEPVAQSVPRISRLMALAIQMDDLLRSRQVANYAELARLSHVTRARVTQVMDLLNLAPDLQEAILNLPPVRRERQCITERTIRPMVRELAWNNQRMMWSHAFFLKIRTWSLPLA